MGTKVKIQWRSTTTSPYAFIPCIDRTLLFTCFLLRFYPSMKRKDGLIHSEGDTRTLLKLQCTTHAKQVQICFSSFTFRKLAALFSFNSFPQAFTDVPLYPHKSNSAQKHPGAYYTVILLHYYTVILLYYYTMVKALRC